MHVLYKLWSSWLDLFTTQVRNYFSYKLALVQQSFFQKLESMIYKFITVQTQTQNLFNGDKF